MEHDLVLEGRVVTRRGIEETEVGVSDGMIAEVRREGVIGSRRIKTGRALIFPGFVDIHTHLREPGWERKEDFRTGALAAAHGGVTTVVDMPNNPVPTVTRRALEEKARLAKRKAVVEVKFYAGVRAGGLAELKSVSSLAVGYKIYLAKTTGDGMLPPEDLGPALEAIAAAKKPVSFHCEDQAVIDRNVEKLRGESRPDLHCDIRSPEAEVESVKKVVAELERREGVSANVCHASTKQAVSLASKARERRVDVRCEATLHHLYFNRRAVLDNPLLKTNPPLRPEGDRRALLEGLRSGDVSFLVTDHAPHTLEEKESLGLSGVPGLDDYGHVVSWLIREQGLDPVTVGIVASANPAEFLGLSDRGGVAVGRRADFTILDLHSPEKVKDEGVRSKCGWSPYEGREFPGRVRWTILAGELLMDDFELVS